MKEKFNAVAAPDKICGAAAGRITYNIFFTPLNSTTFALSKYPCSINIIPLIVPDKTGQKHPMNITATEDKKNVGNIAIRYGVNIDGGIGVNANIIGFKFLFTFGWVPIIIPNTIPQKRAEKYPGIKSFMELMKLSPNLVRDSYILGNILEKPGKNIESNVPVTSVATSYKTKTHIKIIIVPP